MRFPLFAIAAASVFAASCTSDKDLYDENYQNEVEKATYEQNFIKKFGTPAATQDWNMAKTYAVTVDPGTSSNIKIFAPTKAGVSKLVADYNVSGTKTLTFAAPEGTQLVYVVDEFNNVQAVSPNGSVSFKSTRGAGDFNKTDNIDVTYAEHKNISEINSLDYHEYHNLVSSKNHFTVYVQDGGDGAVKAGVTEMGIYFTLNGQEQMVTTWKSPADKASNMTPGFKVDFKNIFPDENTKIAFGLWVKVGDKIIRDTDKVGGNENAGTYAVMGEVNKKESWTCIGFDLTGNKNQKNIVLTIGTGDLNVDDPDPIAWALACEDLGNTDDFDFNDVVFSASHVAGKTTMYVQPLAAGGILNSTIAYKGRTIGEIHELLGAPSNTITNTDTITNEVDPLEFTVAEDLNMEEAMKDFEIQVVNGEKATNKITLRNETKSNVPQVICVPADWYWPTEKTPINEAYSNFTNWVTTGQTEGEAWWAPYTEGKVVVR